MLIVWHTRGKGATPRQKKEPEGSNGHGVEVAAGLLGAADVPTVKAGTFAVLAMITNQGAFGGVAVAKGGVLEPDRLSGALDAGDGKVTVGDGECAVVGLADLEVLNGHGLR